MTSPYTGFEAQWGAGSPVAQREWDDFNKRHKELVEAIMGAASDPGIHQLTGQQIQQPPPVIQQPDSPFGPPRPAARDELIAQARAWGIANPEQMDPQELQLRIQQMRAEMPRDQQTSLGSASLAALGLASEAGGATARVVGNIFGDLRELPFAGPTLASILGTEKAKHWMYDLSQKTAEFTEMARAAQPAQDRVAFEVVAGTGKVAGYALPAMLLWNAVGASGAWVPPAWAGRAASPFVRGALQGGLSGGIMEAGSDEPTASKVFSVGLGFAIGGATALPWLGSGIGLGAVGAGIGSQVGDTPEERRRHAIEGGIAGAALGVAPFFLSAAAKIRQDIPSPLDEQVTAAVKARPMGEDPQRATQRATARITQQQLPAGPDYEFQSTQQTAPELLQIRSEAPLEAPQVFQEPPRQSNLPTRPDYPRLKAALIEAHPLEGTKVVDEAGVPLVVYHGTSVDFENFDMSKADPEALFGPGFYHTENPEVANGYALDGNVKPARLNIQNPFDAEKQMNWPEAAELIDRLEFAAPGYDWDATRSSLRVWLDNGSQAGLGGGGQTGQAIYNALSVTPVKEPVQGPNQNSGEWLGKMYQSGGYTGPSSHYAQYGDAGITPIGKGGLNSALERIGYDGITHEGGRITGGVSHKVWIAFRPDQVHSPWQVTPLDLGDAAASGDALSKQATLIESSTLPQAMGRTKITDTDVIDAAYGSNPAGVSVIRGLNLPSMARGNWDLDNMVLVHRGGNSFDALVGDKRNLTQEIFDDYQNYGVFKGQRVVVAGSGIEAVVVNPAAKKGIMLRRADGRGPPITVGTYKIMPSRFGSSVHQAPQLYESFKLDLLNYMNEEAQKAQMAPVAGVWDPRVSSVLAERSSDFMDRMGIYDPGARQALDEHFNNSWVEELRTLDPEMKAMQETAVHDAYMAHNMSEEDDLHNLPVSLEEKAQSRGFIWISKPEEGGVLKDTVNPGTPDIPLATDQAAHEFLARTDRALPDFTPSSDVPADVAMMLPSDMTQEPQLPTEHMGDSLSNTYEMLSAEDVANLNTPEGQNDLARRLLSSEAAVRGFRQQVGLSTEGPGFGGAGLPPSPPPPPSLPPSGGMGELPPGPQQTLGGQFDKLRRADPIKLHQLVGDITGLTTQGVRYMRYAMLKTERMLTDAGIDMGRAWSHFEAVSTGKALAHNEATPWINEYSDIMRQFPKRTLRDGTVTRIHEIEDPNARYAAWYRLAQSHGLSDRKITSSIAADERLTDFNHRFFTFLTGDPAFGLTADREISRYMSHVRARQAQGAPDPYDVKSLSPEVQFFGEFAREGNLQFRVTDARELGMRMVNGAMFKKHVSAAWEDYVNAWQDSRIPDGIKDFMMDWARLVRYGYDPSGEVATRGIQSVMKKMGVPVTAREAQHLLNMPTGAMYMSMLAGKAGIFFRDATQPWLALAKVRLPFMLGTYGRVLKGAGQVLTKSEANDFREMYQRGLAGGWIERENPNIEAASIYEEPGNLQDNELLAISPEQANRRETMARLSDPLWGLPNWLVRPRESNISTLKWYGRQGQLHRLITGESAYQQALTELQAYRRSTIAAVISRDPTQEIPYESFADRSFFSSFEQPIQRKLRERVDAGDDEGAAQLFAREVSNWSQFRYGRREVPPVLRNNVGRALFMFGNFTGQFLEGMASALANGTPYHKVRYLATIGSVSALMYELKHTTGWSFNKWAWLPYAAQYTGGPLLEKGATAISALSGASNAAYGIRPSETEVSAMQQETRGSLLPNPAEFFPYTGYIRSAAEYGAALQGTNPVEQALRYTITGDRGSSIDIARQIEELGRQQGHIPEGALSPNGGLMPGHTMHDYQMPRQGYEFPHGTTHPGAGAQ